MQLGSNVLVVCIGNVCRSPAGEGFIRTHFQKHYPDYRVSSAGLHALVGQPAVEHTQSVMKDCYGIDVSAHRARQINEEMMQMYNLILVMDDEQKNHLHKLYPFSSGKVQLLGKWRNIEIPDPYRQPIAMFQTQIAAIHDCVNDWIQKIWR